MSIPKVMTLETGASLNPSYKLLVSSVQTQLQVVEKIFFSLNNTSNRRVPEDKSP